jgi:AcrR family transcriptional regulator
MPYPAKTDRQAILSAAFEQVEREGLQSMSLRGLAANLGLAPNALYRYFSDRAALESAIHAETARRLHEALKRAASKRNPVDGIRSMAQTYRKFAHDHRHLCGIMVTPCTPCAGDSAAHDELWAFVIDQVALIASPQHAKEAAVGLWTILQGAIALETAQVFGERKPSKGIDFAVEAWLRAAQAASGETHPSRS